jgi:hypothetical protein
MIFLLVVAAVVVAAPLGAAMLVTVASRHEEAGRTLTGRPPGLLTACARRLLRVPAAVGRGHAESTALDAEFDNLVGMYLPQPRKPTDDDVPARR